MTRPWMEVLATLALQHLWQSAALALLVWLLFRLHRQLDAEARSWILLCAFVLAAILPLAVFLPGKADLSSLPPAVATATTPTQVATAAVSAPAAIGSAASGTNAALPTTLGGIAIGVWLLGFLWRLHRLRADWRAAQRLREGADTLANPRRLFGNAVPGHVVVRVSDRIASPMVVGLERPCILFPRRLLDELPEAALLPILRHELAHIRRGDIPTALIQALCLAVYWWNPLLWLLRAQGDVAREMACDERAAAQSGSATVYANALLAGADKVRALGQPRGALALGILDTRTALTQRIEGLLNMDTSHRISGTRPIVAACTAIIFAGVSMTLLATPRMGAATSTTPATASHAGDGALLVDAASEGRVDIIRLLVKNGADINARAIGDGTALIVAAKRGDVAMVKELIALGAKVDQPSPGDGNPLIAAAARGHEDVARILVDAGANVNAIVVGDETPLINAARRGHLSIVRYLVEHGADVNLGMIADRGEWRSPLNQASNPVIQAYLASKGAVEHK